MTSNATDFLPGTLELLILRTLSWESQHGYGIAQRLHEKTRDALVVQDAALYQALRRLEKKGWVDAEWRQTENNRRARYYRLTKHGRAELTREAAAWREYAEAVLRVLGPEPGGAAP